VVTVTAFAKDCWSFTFDGRVISRVGQFAMPVAQEMDRLIFAVGMEQRYLGEVCIPVPDAKVLQLNVMPTDVTFEFRDGKLVPAGEVFKGSVSTVARDVPHLKVVSSTDGSVALVLAMTREGLRHVSGKGTVTTPSGKVYSFPR
jgi:hypothetical protein